jgi:hypothetical protein
MGQLSSLPTVRTEALAPGDIVLIRQPLVTAFGTIDAGVLRGVAASQRGNYFSAQQQKVAGTWRRGSPFTAGVTLQAGNWGTPPDHATGLP